MRTKAAPQMTLFSAISFILGGCGDASTATTTAETTGDAEAPDYTAAFPQDRVARLDLTIRAENWQAMLDDMTSMAGEFGAQAGVGLGGGMAPAGGGSLGGNMETPQELIDACSASASGDACTASVMGMEVSGTCADPGTGLFCQPDASLMPADGSGAPGGAGGDLAGGNFELLPRDPLYVECDVSNGSRTLHHVGVRFKGNSSLANAWMQGIWKLPLRLKFDEFEDLYPDTLDQRFYGFKAIGLSNGSADPSFLRDKLGTEVFANAGFAAPATAFYRVFIDHGEGPVYFGLYTGIEIPSDNAFLDTQFGGHAGNLYKPSGTGAMWATWDEATLGKENHEDAADYADAQALFDALHADRANPVVWRAELERHLDVDTFLHWLALNTVIQDWDTYGMMAHNYYLYSDPNQGSRFVWIPWDHSYAFNPQSALSLEMNEVTEQWPLIRYLLDDPEYQSVYQNYVAQAVALEYTSAWVRERFRAAHDLIAPYVTGDEGEKTGFTFMTSAADFDASVDGFIAHAEQRQSDVAAYLKR